MSTMRVGVCFDADVLKQSRYKPTLSSLDVLLFPELMDGGYAAITNGKPPHSLHDELISSLKKSSKDFSCTIIAGSVFFKHAASHPTNTSLVFNRGRLIHWYDKIHLFKPTGDTKFFRPGKPEVRTFNISTRRAKVRAGVVICYDVRFPELMRAMALQGMKILFVPARWPKARDEAWQSLLKARAIENQNFVVGCDSLDEEGGYSYAFDPFGKMIFSNKKDNRKLLHIFEIDLSQLQVACKLHQNVREAVFLKKLM